MADYALARISFLWRGGLGLMDHTRRKGSAASSRVNADQGQRDAKSR